MKKLDNLCTMKVDSRLWVLTSPLTFRESGGGLYQIPTGFFTDGASTPRILWSICPPMDGDSAEPAVLHDWLYSKSCPLVFTRKEADDIFLEAMRCAGVLWARRTAIYSGVRIGGSSSFRACFDWEKLIK